MPALLVHPASRRNLHLFIVLSFELADSIASSSSSRAACDFTRLSCVAEQRCSGCCNSNLAISRRSEASRRRDWDVGDPLDVCEWSSTSGDLTDAALSSSNKRDWK